MSETPEEQQEQPKRRRNRMLLLSNRAKAFGFVALLTAILGGVIFVQTRAYLRGTERDRLVKQLNSERTASARAQLAWKILALDPTEEHSRRILLQLSEPIGMETMLRGLDPDLLAEPRDATFRLLAARRRFGQEDHAGAARILTALRARDKQRVPDAVRLLRCHLRLDRRQEALAIAMELGPRHPEARIDVLKAMLRARSLLARPVACEAALACFQNRDNRAPAADLIELLLENERHDLANLLLGSTFSSIAGRLEPLRERVARHLAEGLAARLRKGRDATRPPSEGDLKLLAPACDPWGKPFTLRKDRLAVVAGAGRSALVEVALFPPAAPPPAGKTQ